MDAIDKMLEEDLIRIPSGISTCFYSSFVFVINAIVAYYYKYYLFSFLFVLVFISSLFVHYVNRSCTSLIIDKIFIIFIVFYGGFLFYQKLWEIEEFNFRNVTFSVLIVFTFLLTNYLYYYGYVFNQYCYNPDITVANNYHSFLHLISSLGHNLIVLL